MTFENEKKTEEGTILRNDTNPLRVRLDQEQVVHPRPHKVCYLQSFSSGSDGPLQ